MSDSRYPIGKYEPQAFSNELKAQWLADIKFLPNAIESAISNLDEHQLQTPYREGGWTVHQVVHHVADSHVNAYCPFLSWVIQKEKLLSGPTKKNYGRKQPM
jgi:hypothetical protein